MRSVDLAGRCVLVLGAGTDPGSLAARELADAGAQVTAADPCVDRLRARLGGDERIVLRQTDDRDPLALSALVQELTDVDVVVWATSSDEDAGGLACITASEVATCWSVFEQFAPPLAARGGGSMVVLSALPGRREGSVSRSAPWRAVREVVRDCAVHLEPRGVRVNAVLLGEGHGTGALTFLASQESRWLTGSAVAVQSGWSRLERLVPATVPA